MAVLQIGRLGLGAPATPFTEPMGDPIAGAGGATVAAPRTPLQAQVAIATYVDGTTTVAQGQTLRRQLRSMLNNTPLKLQAFLYVMYSDDMEQNGWYAPDVTTLAGIDATSWLAGMWQTGSGNFNLIGRQRTHREAREIWMKDLTTGLYPRDTLGWIYSMDFAALPSLQLSTLPNGVVQAADTVSGQALVLTTLPTGRDGGQACVTEGLVDTEVVSYEHLESAMNLGDVVVYDRRGQITAPATGPDTLWEEVYGPDYAWGWLS